MNGYTGAEMEELFIGMIDSFPKTFRRVSVRHSSEELVNLALKYVPNKVATLLRSTDNSLDSLMKQDQRWILDMLFNCDCLIAVNFGGKGKLVAVDVTKNVTQLIAKERKMQSQAELMGAIGIEIGIVVLWDMDLVKFLQNPDLKRWGKEVYSAVNNIAVGSNFAGVVILSNKGE